MHTLIGLSPRRGRPAYGLVWIFAFSYTYGVLGEWLRRGFLWESGRLDGGFPEKLSALYVYLTDAEDRGFMFNCV